MKTISEITILTPTYDDWESVFVLFSQLDDVLEANGLTANIVGHYEGIQYGLTVIGQLGVSSRGRFVHGPLRISINNFH